MISDLEKKIIKNISKQYQIKHVFLFGSSINPKREYRDIDIAIEGISPKKFYQFYGDLLFALSKPVDVIDLSNMSKFAQLIKKEGILLYG